MSAACRILVVDDERGVRGILCRLLVQEGHEPLEAADGQQALALISHERLDAVLLDLKMPGLDGMEVLRQAKVLNHDLPIIVVTADPRAQNAVAALHSGAYDYLVKPFKPTDVMRSVRRAMNERQAHRIAQASPRPTSDVPCLQEMMGTSEAIAMISAEVTRVASSDFAVLILGETGTGKEIIARAIHDESRRGSGPFVALDCAAIPESLFENELFGHEKGAFTGSDRGVPGKFELANGGTLFLDEISNMPLGSQAKLLRVLQERRIWRVGGTRSTPIDVRPVAASNQDLENALTRHSFRRDLFFRLNEFVIRIPPLRHRRQDIVFLAKRFLDQASGELRKPVQGLTERAVEQLLSHDWPGNVRQLRSVIRRAALLADGVIDDNHLALREGEHPAGDHRPVDPAAPNTWESLRQRVHRSVMTVEQTALREALNAADGNKAQAARLLHIDYKTLHTKLKEYGITRLIGGGHVQKDK